MISILTTVTNPRERQDKAIEAVNCYADLADEVIIVNGGDEVGMAWLLSEAYTQGKVSKIDLEWPKEWNWLELPRHLNHGLRQCSEEWVLKLDIDQLIHEDDFDKLKSAIRRCPKGCDVITLQKMSMTYGKKYYQKGGQGILFRNRSYISFGDNVDKQTDLCFPVDTRGAKPSTHMLGEMEYVLPVGRTSNEFKSGVAYWNYDYFFKTEDFTRKEFWRFSRAYHRYTSKWTFGKDKDDAFHVFLNMMQGRHDRSPYTYKLGDHPKYIRDAVRNISSDRFGYSGWDY